MHDEEVEQENGDYFKLLLISTLNVKPRTTIYYCQPSTHHHYINTTCLLIQQLLHLVNLFISKLKIV